jgi:membrane protein DedA with SNARE-associated domain
MFLNHLLDVVRLAAGSWLAECAALFLVPFLHEDVAIIGGALLIVGHRLPVGLVLLSLYAGMVVSDFALYGLGGAARRNRLARRLLISPRVRRLGLWLGRHMTPLVLVARLVPGMMFPTYVACGWFGLSLRRFAVASMAMAAGYLPVMLSVYILFGQAAITRIGSWVWLALLIPVTAGALLRWRPPLGSFLAPFAAPAAWLRRRGLFAPLVLPQPVPERVRSRPEPDRRPLEPIDRARP